MMDIQKKTKTSVNALPKSALKIACYLCWLASIEIVVHQCQGTLPLIHLHTITRQIQKAQSRRLFQGWNNRVFQAVEGRLLGQNLVDFTGEQRVMRLEVPSYNVYTSASHMCCLFRGSVDTREIMWNVRTIPPASLNKSSINRSPDCCKKNMDWRWAESKWFLGTLKIGPSIY